MNKFFDQKPPIFLFLIFLSVFFTNQFSVAGIPTDPSDYNKKALTAINTMTSSSIQTGKYSNHYFHHKSKHKQALIVLTGVAEPAIKFWEVFYLFKDNFDLYFWDHVNQGHSPDLLTDIDYKKVHIDSFETYTLTLNNFLTQLEPKYEKINVISHSTGSQIALNLILKRPHLIDQFVGITPMVSINNLFVPKWLIKIIVQKFYQPTEWGPFQGDKNPSFKYLTNSETNFENYQEFVKKYYPKSLSTGVTAKWILEAMRSNKKLRASVQKLNQSKTKFMFFTAGRDRVVKFRAAADLCDQLDKCDRLHYSQSKHQLHIEVDEYRLDMYKKSKNFLSPPK